MLKNIFHSTIRVSGPMTGWILVAAFGMRSPAPTVVGQFPMASPASAEFSDSAAGGRDVQVGVTVRRVASLASAQAFLSGRGTVRSLADEG